VNGCFDPLPRTWALNMALDQATRRGWTTSTWPSAKHCRGRGDALEPQVVTCLIGRELLLVLDNFEQVLPARTMVAGLLARTPDAKILHQ
jgi:hypothetical protein